jgi:GNAT superfamily N-acetyltransferase
MTAIATHHLMQCGSDVVRFFGRGASALCRIDEHGWLGLSGERGTADLNMAFVARTAPASLVEEYAKTIGDLGLNAILIVDEEAPALVEAGTKVGLVPVGSVPVMEWEGKPHPEPSSRYTVQAVTSEEMEDVIRLIADAFALDEPTLQRVVPAELADEEDLDFWLAIEGGDTAVGTGTFIRTGDHCGIYNMGTPQAGQRKGAGRAVLDSAMAHYLADGVTSFTLEATAAGFHLYEQVGFETVASPTVLLVGESTQFPG